jgi:hypothetical protein
MNILTSVRNQVLKLNYYIQRSIFFYTDKVYHGLNQKNQRQWNGICPEKTIVWYVSRFLLIDPNLINKDEKGVLSQYFLLKNALKKYRQIEQKRLENKLSITTSSPLTVVTVAIHDCADKTTIIHFGRFV